MRGGEWRVVRGWLRGVREGEWIGVGGAEWRGVGRGE